MALEIHVFLNLWCALYHEEACGSMVGVCVWYGKGYDFISWLVHE